MVFLIRLLRVATALFALWAIATHAASTEEASQRPSLDLIREIEQKVKLPEGAAPLIDYVRYYYASPASGPGVIVGMYVTRNYIDSSEIPSEAIVVVDSDADVPAPWDAGCSVVTVKFAPRNTASLDAWCSPTLFPESDRVAERVAQASLLGALFVWFAWPSRKPRTRLRQAPPWNVAIVCAAWIWLSVELVLTQSTGCGRFGTFSWRCWDFSIAYTYIWLTVAGALFCCALLSLFGIRVGRVTLLASMVALACWLVLQSMWLVSAYPELGPLQWLWAGLTRFDAFRLLAWSAILGLSAWALLGKNAGVFYARSAQQAHARDVRNARA